MITETLFFSGGLLLGMFLMAIIVIKQPHLLMSAVTGELSQELINSFGKQDLGQKETQEAEFKEKEKGESK